MPVVLQRKSHYDVMHYNMIEHARRSHVQQCREIDYADHTTNAERLIIQITRQCREIDYADHTTNAERLIIQITQQCREIH